jgi:DNA-directed RNA polymerase I subunit RPA43
MSKSCSPLGWFSGPTAPQPSPSRPSIPKRRQLFLHQHQQLTTCANRKSQRPHKRLTMAPLPDTNLYTERITQYVSLPPAALAAPLPALCASIFSPLLLSYFPPARGIVLAYEDVALSSSPPGTSTSDQDSVLLRHVDEYAAPFLWATATFLIFRPRRGSYISARVTGQSKTHITLSYLNIFPISVLATQLPETWTFQAGTTDEGVWQTEEGDLSGDVQVRLLDFDARTDGKSKGKGMRLEGSLVGEEVQKRKEKSKGKGKKGILKGAQAAVEA